MKDWAKRLDGRMNQRQVRHAMTAREVGTDRKTLQGLRDGVAPRNLPTDQFLRLCELLDMTPDQFFGVAAMDGADPPLPSPLAGPEEYRIAGALQALHPDDRAVAAEILEALSRLHNPEVADTEEPRPAPRPRRRRTAGGS